MCGVAGFIGFQDNVKLAEMANHIQSHRGPDNQEVWHDQYLAFAHQRLSIIDLSDAANQPFHKGGFVMIFNGEIYNYKALQKKLSAEKGVQFQTSSDTEVVLEMFIHYGAESLDHLVGMFAFAIYHKVTRELFIARDHFGIKPLFYTQIEEGFAFSSELKTLTQIPGFDKTINAKALVSSLNYLWVSGNESMFEGCWKLPPAHYLRYIPGKPIEVEKYWELDTDPRKQLPPDEEALIQDVAETVEQSIKRHMVADVPVSSFLSGGLDSSLISVIAKQSNPQLSTYTIGTLAQDKKGEGMPDDEKYADLLARKFQLDHNVIRITPNILRDLPQMVRTLDEPIGDPAAINTYLICKAARDKGVKVLLSGMGADEFYFGYRRQKATLLAMKYNKLPGFLRSIVASVVKLMPVKIGNKAFKLGRWAKRFISFTNMPIDETYMRSYSYYHPEDLKQLLAPQYRSAVDQIREEHREIFRSAYQGDTVNQICHTDIQLFMLGLNLTYTDRASMAASVEVRVPYIDKEVIQRAMRIPGEIKYQKKQPKYILKKAAEKFLPQEIIYRPKAAFGAPIRSWISGDLKGMVDDMLSEEKIKKRGILNYARVKQLIENDRAGTEDNAYQIYQLLTLELWLSTYIDATDDQLEEVVAAYLSGN